jgi:hypothetical protein
MINAYRDIREFKKRRKNVPDLRTAALRFLSTKYAIVTTPWVFSRKAYFIFFARAGNFTHSALFYILRLLKSSFTASEPLRYADAAHLYVKLPTMYSVLVIALALCWCCVSYSIPVSYRLNEAIHKNLVRVQLKGAKIDTAFRGEISAHYGPCIAMDITNNSVQALNLELEYGYQLMPDDTSIQTMMVTRNLQVYLSPAQKKSLRIYAMCIEATDHVPNEKVNFVLQKRATGNLLSIAEFLNRKNYQGAVAQDAVWCISNDRDLHSIYSADTAMMYDLRRYVAKLKGLPEKEIYERSDMSSRLSTGSFTTYYYTVSRLVELQFVGWCQSVDCSF